MNDDQFNDLMAAVRDIDAMLRKERESRARCVINVSVMPCDPQTCNQIADGISRRRRISRNRDA